MGSETDRLHEELREVRQDLADAVDDVERLLWLSGLCQYCAKVKGKGNRRLDNPCKICEPQWRGPKKRRKPLWND